MNRTYMRYGSIAVAVLILIIILIWMFSGSGPAIVETRPAITDVQISVINPVEVTDYFEAAGIVEANSISEIASRIMGTVSVVSVHQGQKVSAGQELLTIYNKDLTQRLNAGRAAYEEAAKALDVARENKSLADVTYNRYRKLADERAISGQEFDQIENKKKVADLEFARAEMQRSRAQSAYEEAKVNSSFAIITAPSDGIVTRKFIDAGSMAAPGATLLTIEDANRFKVEANLDERLSEVVKIGTPISIIIDSIGAELSVPISEIVPAVDPQARSFIIKALLSREKIRLKSGLYARVLVPLEKKKALLVPTKAVISKGQLTGVYIVDGNAVSYRLVRTGKKHGDRYEILSGLTAGEKIITEGADHAIDGGMVNRSSI